MFYMTRTVLVELANYSEPRVSGHRMERNNSMRNLFTFFSLYEQSPLNNPHMHNVLVSPRTPLVHRRHHFVLLPISYK